MPAPKKLQKMGIEQVITYVLRNPDKNLPKLGEWVEKFSGKSFDMQKRLVISAITDKNNIYNGLLLRLLKSADKEVIKNLFLNFFFNMHLLGADRRQDLRKEYNCNAPLVSMVEPVSPVNDSYLTFSDLNRLVSQGKEIGIFVYILAGTDPLTKKDDIMRLCENHSDCVFLCITQGKSIDEYLIRKIEKVKNFLPFIELSGYESYMNEKYGHGSFDDAFNAISLLKNNHLPFGISCCYVKENAKVITSERFYEAMMATGATFVNFHYLYVDRNSDEKDLLTLEECEEIRQKLKEYRKIKPLFALNFQNSTKDLEGCLAGGRKYLYIGSNGDIKPCEYMEGSALNIHNMTLKEALISPQMRAYTEGEKTDAEFNCFCPTCKDIEN